MIDLMTPVPLAEAVRDLGARTPVGSILRSAEWAQMPRVLRDEALFSAGVTSLRVLGEIGARLDKMIALESEPTASGEDAMATRSTFIGDLKRILADFGYRPEPGKEGGLQDLSSARRLRLIADMNLQQAQERARFKMGQDPDMLDNFPAQELVRMESRMVPRQWRQRWAEAGGKFFDGRMIALKSDPVWVKISRFGRPWPPFDFGSGMGIEDVERGEAEALGLIAPEETPEPVEAGMRAEGEAELKGALERPGFAKALKSLFGDQIEIDGTTARWVDRTGAANTRAYRRDQLGRFAKDGGPLSREDNLRRGKAAIERALRRQEDVPGAMSVARLGVIDFEWGRPGTAKPNPAGATHADGYGISHIVAKHGVAAARKLPEVLALGDIKPHLADGSKRVVRLKGWMAVVQYKSATRAYVVTSFDEEAKK
jgi:hypothetical protein